MFINHYRRSSIVRIIVSFTVCLCMLTLVARAMESKTVALVSGISGKGLPLLEGSGKYIVIESGQRLLLTDRLFVRKGSVSLTLLNLGTGGLVTTTLSSGTSREVKDILEGKKNSIFASLYRGVAGLFSPKIQNVTRLGGAQAGLMHNPTHEALPPKAMRPQKLPRPRKVRRSREVKGLESARKHPYGSALSSSRDNFTGKYPVAPERKDAESLSLHEGISQHSVSSSDRNEYLHVRPFTEIELVKPGSGRGFPLGQLRFILRKEIKGVYLAISRIRSGKVKRYPRILMNSTRFPTLILDPRKHHFLVGDHLQYGFQTYNGKTLGRKYWFTLINPWHWVRIHDILDAASSEPPGPQRRALLLLSAQAWLKVGSLREAGLIYLTLSKEKDVSHQDSEVFQRKYRKLRKMISLESLR